MFSWFDRREAFINAALALREPLQETEQYLSTRRTVHGYCVCCRRVTRMRVKSGAAFGSVPNLREGMSCLRCKLSNRARLMFQAIEQAMPDPGAAAALLECGSPLQRQLAARYQALLGSEFLDPQYVSGQHYPYRRGSVRHESMLDLSYADNSLALIAHADVLEHIYDYRAALAQCQRVLRPHGQLIFTMPFFMFMPEHLLRGRLLPSGELEHLQPPEYHGDGVRKQGIYTFHYFGWALLDDLRAAGFRSAQIGLDYDAFAGFVSNHHPQFEVGLMLPVLFRAIK